MSSHDVLREDDAVDDAEGDGGGSFRFEVVPRRRPLDGFMIDTVSVDPDPLWLEELAVVAVVAEVAEVAVPEAVGDGTANRTERRRLERGREGMVFEGLSF